MDVMLLTRVAAWSLPFAIVSMAAQVSAKSPMPTIDTSSSKAPSLRGGLQGHDGMTIARLRGQFHLLDPNGRAVLAMEPKLQGMYHDGKKPIRRQAKVRDWRHVKDETGWQLIGQHHGTYAHWRLTWSGSRQRPTVALKVEVTYRAKVAVIHESLRFKLSDQRSRSVSGAIFDRSYRWRPVRRLHRIDQWTPQRFRWGKGLSAYTLEAEAQSMAVRPQGRGYELQLDVDDARNHPLSIFRQCWSAYAKVQEGLRRDKSAQWRTPGERAHLAAAVSPWTGLQIEKRRYPKGFRAAVVFTDHADQSSGARLAALMYGEGRDKPPHSPEQPSRGFATHGLGMSKSVYARGGAFKQLDGPGYRAVVRRLLRETAGRIEIGPHSTSGRRESRLSALKDLQDFQKLGARFWIDHQPSTNCEAITNQGADERTKYHITDVLGHYGYDYVWSGLDRRQRKGSLNLFQPSRTGQHQPILFQHNKVDGKRRSLWLFSSVWAAHDFSQFLQRYAPRRLDGLVREHGLHIAHTYLDSYSAGGAMKRWSLLERVPGGFRLKKKAEGLFRDFAARQRAGDLWMTGVVALGDHLIGMADVRIRPQNDGSFRLHHEGARDLEGATFSVPSDAGAPHLDGRPLPQAQIRSLRREKKRIFWFDLAAGQTATLSFSEGARAKPRRATTRGSRLLWTEPPARLLSRP